MENTDRTTDSTGVEKKETTKIPDTKETAEEYAKWVQTATYLLVQQDLERKESKGKVSKHKVDAQLKEFKKQIDSASLEQIREFLKSTLTVLKFDPSEEACGIIDQILKHEATSVKIVKWTSLKQVSPKWKVSVWRGDITTLEVDAIVNAANSYLLGCFTPNHPCIDNVIHCKAGPRLRAECRQIMDKQKHLEETGQAKITKAYCLPSKFVLHTVGPIAKYPGHTQPKLLQSCYDECLRASKENGIRTIAFCCISTGVFGYPQVAAAHVALKTVKAWLSNSENAASVDMIIFNVFTQKDHEIYLELAPQYFADEDKP